MDAGEEQETRRPAYGDTMSYQVLSVLPLWQCQYGTVAESRPGSHTRVGLLPRSPCGPQPGAPRKTGWSSGSGTPMARRTPESAARHTKGTGHPDESWGRTQGEAPPDQLVTGRAGEPELTARQITGRGEHTAFPLPCPHISLPQGGAPWSVRYMNREPL